MKYCFTLSVLRIFVFSFLIISLSSGLLPAAAAAGSIKGKVTDISTGQPLPGVTVQIEGLNAGSVSDEEGNYAINNIPPGSYQLKASAIGYVTVIKTDIIVSSARPVIADFQLKEQVIELKGVTVTGGYFQKNPYEANSIANFSYEEIRRAPGGFEDVVRALSVLPGVAQADAGRNDLIVRGGAPSENLYVLDNITIPNINHFGSQGATGGPLSYINLDFVKETSFSTGGFPVIYGDKLSSVLNINLREGRTDRLGGKLTVSATQFGLNAEGPVSDNSNFIFSARRSYLDFIFKAAGFAFVPEYYDVLGKFSYNPDSHNSFSYLFVSAFDNVKYFNDTPEKRFDNSRTLGSDQTQYVTGINYRHLFKNGILNISLNRNYTDFDTSQRDSLQNPIFLNKSVEAENALSGNITLKLSPSSELNFGSTGKIVKFRSDIRIPAFRTTFGDTLLINSLYTDENYLKGAVYAQYSYLFSGKLQLNFGARADYFEAINSKWTVSPRFSASYYLTPITALNLSAGIFYQTPSYLWLAADRRNRDLKSIRADHYIAGIEHRLRSDLQVKAEAFYKNYSSYPASLLRPYLVLANTGAGFAGSDDNFSSFGLEPLVSLGKGRVQGMELLLQKKSAETPHYGIFSLTYSQSYFTAIDNIERTGSYDQRWILNLTGGYIFNEKWEASVKFRYSTGKPYTPFNFDGTQDIALYNTKRLPSNHSLDLRLDRRWNFEKWTLITYLDIQNVYNRKNPNFLRWDPKTKTAEGSSSIGILPSIGISAEL